MQFCGSFECILLLRWKNWTILQKSFNIILQMDFKRYHSELLLYETYIDVDYFNLNLYILFKVHLNSFIFIHFFSCSFKWFLLNFLAFFSVDFLFNLLICYLIKDSKPTSSNHFYDFFSWLKYFLELKIFFFTLFSILQILS